MSQDLPDAKIISESANGDKIIAADWLLVQIQMASPYARVIESYAAEWKVPIHIALFIVISLGIHAKIGGTDQATAQRLIDKNIMLWQEHGPI